MTGRYKTALILVLAPLLAYLALLNISDRQSWKTPSDGITWIVSDDGLLVGSLKQGIHLDGVGTGATLTRIDGLETHNLDEYTEILEALSSTAPGETLAQYTFRTADGREVTLPVTIGAENQFDRSEIPAILVAFSFLGIGIFIFLRNGKEPGAFQFTIICLVAFVLLAFRYSGRADPFDLAVYWFSGVAFLLLPPLFLHFCACFPEGDGRTCLQPKLKLIFYLPGSFLLGIHLLWFLGRLQPVGMPRTPAVGHFLDRVELTHFMALFLLSILAVLNAHRASSGATYRKQVKWILGGSFLGFVPFAIVYGIPYAAGIPIRGWMELSVISLAIIPLSFGYAISKYRLMDVDLIFQRGAAYVIASSALFAFYVGVILLIAKTVHDFSSQSSFFLLAISAVIAAFLFAPLKNRIQEQLDRYFYKDRYGYRRSLMSFGRNLGTEINLSRLTQRLLDRIHKALDVEPVAVFLRDENLSHRFRLESVHGLHAFDSVPNIEMPQFTAVESGRDSLAEYMQQVKEQLVRWSVRHVEPLTVRGRLIGFIALGRRRSGDFLSSEDLEMLETIAGYAAIAIDNALLYRSLESKASELSSLQLYSRNVIESINLGVAVVSPEGQITVWNNAMSTVTGIYKGDALEKRLSDLLPADLVEAMQRVVDGPEWLVHMPRHLYKTYTECQDGVARLLNVTLAPFISQEDVNTGTLIIFDDVTEKVQLENQLQQAEKLTSIGLFAAGLAHEVNTPLAGISSYAQMLMGETQPDDPKRPYLEKIEKQSFRASEILNNLLKFAHFSDSDFREVNLNAVVVETLSLLEHQFRMGSVEVALELEPTLPTTLGNEGKLQQVFMNIFLNAKDAMPEGGEIKLKTCTRDSQIIVEVADTGIGISEEDKKRIYDPFFTTKSIGKGTGLGLSVSYGIIQEHSGRISVSSPPEGGTTFSLYFPLKRVH